MVISLNVTSRSVPKVKSAQTQPKKPSEPQLKKKKSAPENNEFSFNFTKNSAVKAVVAKRRNPALLAKKSAAAAAKPAAAAIPPPTKASSSSAQPSAKAQNPALLAKKSAATAAKPTAAAIPPPTKASSSSAQPAAKAQTPAKPIVDAAPLPTYSFDDADNASLSLNVTAGNADDLLQSAARREKKQLNSKQRKEKVLETRARAFQAQEAQAIDTTGKAELAAAVAAATAASAAPPSAKSAALKAAKATGTAPAAATKKPPADKPKKMASLFANNPAVPVVGQRLVNPLKETVFTGASMDSIGLHPHAVKNLADVLHITELTNVQQRTVPIVLQGRDVLVRSQTGSGKTLAYALPIVQQLQAVRPKLTREAGIQALVIVPTRELAIQVYELFVKLLKPFTWIVSGFLTGGEKRKAEKARLRKGLNILVGTPGRLVDHLLHTESFKLDQVRWLVLDEADRLFEMGYEKDVQKIVDVLNGKGGAVGSTAPGNPFARRDPSTVVVAAAAPKPIAEQPNAAAGEIALPSRLQSMLLSATLTAAVRQLAGLALKDPHFIDTTDVNQADIQRTNAFDAVDEAMADEKITLPATVRQAYVLVPPKLRLVTLSGLIANEARRSGSGGGATKMLVFMGSEHLVDFHYDVMNEALTKKVLDSDDEDVVVSDDDDVTGVKVTGKKRKKQAGRKLLADDYDSDAGDDGEEPYLTGVRFFKLHGALTQTERSAVFKAFKESRSGVLLTTDVAGRGIDVPHVDLVVQFSPPQRIADYVHRVGRTGRAGRSGRALLFLSPNETEFIQILESKKIRIAQDDADALLKGIVRPQSANATLEENASELQRKFESIVADDKEMHERACKAFVSWLRFIAAFPKDLRTIFNIKQAHMGHYAKSLGLREPPTRFAGKHSAPKPQAPTNRLTYSERSSEPRAPKSGADSKSSAADGANKRPHANNLNFNKFIKKSISLQTSEFGSGLPPAKKRKT